MITAPDPTRVTEATPNLAWIVRQLCERPPWQDYEPFAVDYRRYQEAEAELTNVLKERGWHAPPSSAQIGRPNFVVLGTPIVMES